MRGRHAIAGTLIVVVGTVTVGGCGSDRVATVAVTYSRAATVIDNPMSIGNTGMTKPQLHWGSGDQLILTTWGSGSCPSLPIDVTVQNAHRITIGLGSDDGGGCTADLTAINSVIVAPAGLDSSKPVIATIQGNEVTLSPRS